MLFNDRKGGQVVEVHHEDVLPTDSDVANYKHFKAAGQGFDANAMDDPYHPNHALSRADFELQTRVSDATSSIWHRQAAAKRAGSRIVSPGKK